VSAQRAKLLFVRHVHIFTVQSSERSQRGSGP